MKKTYYILASLLILGSCEKYTEDLNKDPNEFITAPSELIIGQAQLGWMQLATSNSARYAGIFMNQFTGEDRQYVTVNQYSTTAADYDDTWDDALVDGIAQAQLAKSLALEDGNQILAGIATICEAAIFGEMTALFGDIPFSETNNIDNTATPKFDSQSDVLAGVQSLLDDAISKVGDSQASLYSGNRLSSEATWKEIAYSLKARYYLIAKDYQNALTNARKGINTPEKSLQTRHTTALNSENLYYQFMVDERDGYLGATDSYLVRIMSGLDERNIETPGDSLRFKHYFTPYSDGSGHAPNTSTNGVFAETAPMNIISFEEVMLIEAEAANRVKDNGDVSAFNNVRKYLYEKYFEEYKDTTLKPEYSAGEVNANFTLKITENPTNGEVKVEITDNDTPEDTSDDSVMITYTSTSETGEGDSFTYEICDDSETPLCELVTVDIPSGGFPKTVSESGSTDLLKEIIEEKYICLIGELQPFHDIRRTNNILGIPPKTGSTIPQRFIYPQVEIDTNPNVPSPLPTLFDKTPVNK